MSVMNCLRAGCFLKDRGLLFAMVVKCVNGETLDQHIWVRIRQESAVYRHLCGSN